MKSNATIFVTFMMSGLHNWPGAPEHRAYLSHTHRHLFNVRVETEVTHDDRQIEFHDLLDEAKDLFRTCQTELGMGRSCEQMARWLGERLADKHKQWFEVTVDEDGECGASVTSFDQRT